GIDGPDDNRCHRDPGNSGRRRRHAPRPRGRRQHRCARDRKTGGNNLLQRPVRHPCSCQARVHVTRLQTGADASTAFHVFEFGGRYLESYDRRVMSRPGGPNRRSFLSTVLAAPAALSPVKAGAADAARKPNETAASSLEPVSYPRTFTGPSLKMISFPLGGVGAGSIGLGGRGQLRDWQIFNRADKGNSPDYAFAGIWAQAPGHKPVTRVLESR